MLKPDFEQWLQAYLLKKRWNVLNKLDFILGSNILVELLQVTFASPPSSRISPD
jgi:hypothetical protein